MNRTFSSIMAKLTACGFALAMVTAVALAQGPARGPGGQRGPGGFGGFGGFGGPGGPGGFGGPSLVLSPEVQKDLGLTAKQETQIKRVMASLDQKRREAFAPPAEGSEGGDPRSRMMEMFELQRSAEASVTKALNKRQKDRLAQLELQREGKMAVARKEVASKLKLTTSQNKAVKSAIEEMRTAMARSMPRPPGGGPGFGGPGNRRGRQNNPTEGNETENANANANANSESEPSEPAETAPATKGEGDSNRPGGRRGGRPDFNSPEFRAQMEKMRETQKKIRDEATAKISEILTEEQNASFEKMIGKPFDFSKLTPPGGGFGGRRGGRPQESR